MSMTSERIFAVAVGAESVVQETGSASGITEKVALQIEILTSLDRFIDLRPEWEALMDEAQIPHPFLRHVWLRSWWESFGADAEQLRIIVIREARRLVAVAPMVLKRTRLFGFRVQNLESIYSPHMPRFDFALSTTRQGEVYALLWKAMAGMPCDAIILKQFPKETATLTALHNRAVAAGWFGGKAAGARQPYLGFNEDPRSPLRQVTSKQRYNLRNRLKSLSSIGDVRLQQITEPAQIEDALKDGLSLEAAGWKGEAGTAIASDPQIESFYSRLAKGAAALGWLRLQFLTLDGRRIAFNYGIEYGNTSFSIKIGHDPQYRRYAPGHTLTWLILQDAGQRGYTEFDFLGDDDPWKLTWTRDLHLHTWLFLFRPRAKGWLLNALKFRVVPLTKRLRAIVPARRRRLIDDVSK